MKCSTFLKTHCKLKYISRVFNAMEHTTTLLSLSLSVSIYTSLYLYLCVSLYLCLSVILCHTLSTQTNDKSIKNPQSFQCFTLPAQKTVIRLELLAGTYVDSMFNELCIYYTDTYIYIQLYSSLATPTTHT